LFFVSFSFLSYAFLSPRFYFIAVFLSRAYSLPSLRAFFAAFFLNRSTLALVYFAKTTSGDEGADDGL
jgi:hypothetical protein